MLVVLRKLLRPLRWFSTNKQQNADKVGSVKSLNRIHELAKEIFPKMQGFSAAQQIRIMHIFSKYELRDPEQFDKTEEKLARNLNKVTLPQAVTLLQAMLVYHGKYDSQRILFLCLHKYLLKLKELPVEQLLPLVNVLARLKWSGKVINHVVGLAINNQTKLQGMSLQHSIRVCILLAQQKDANLGHLAKLLETVITNLQKTEFSKLDHTDAALVYCLLFSDFLLGRLGRIVEYLQAEKQILGSVSGPLELQDCQQRILELLTDVNNTFRSDYEQRILKMRPNLTTEELTFFGSTKQPKMRQFLKEAYLKSFLKATPMEFVSLLRDFGQPKQLQQYLDRHQANMDINEILYVLQRTHTIFPKTPIVKYLRILLESPVEEFNSKQFEWLVKLSVSASVPQQEVQAFIRRCSK